MLRFQMDTYMWPLALYFHMGCISDLWPAKIRQEGETTRAKFSYIEEMGRKNSLRGNKEGRLSLLQQITIFYSSVFQNILYFQQN